MFDPDQLPMPDLGLVCRECGYPLAHLTAHRCPECGWAFEIDDLIPPGYFPPLYAEGKPVRGTPEVLELLQTYGVPYIAEVDPALGVFGMVRMSSRVGDPLTVPRERYLEVIDLLRRRALGEAMPPPPAANDRTEPWDCPDCGEENPGHFELCWNCERPIDARPPL